MEFGEKLCELRKNKGLTQAELAEALYVSRTAVSKWESGRGYPSIDSLREISCYFSVSIDDLLSGEKIISIAKHENRSNIKNTCELLFGICDLLYIALIFLPLYSIPMGNRVCAVNLPAYLEKAPQSHMLYLLMFSALSAAGAAKTLLSILRFEKVQGALTVFSVVLGVFAVLLSALSREVYAISAAFILITIKGVLLLKYTKNG